MVPKKSQTKIIKLVEEALKDGSIDKWDDATQELSKYKDFGNYEVIVNYGRNAMFRYSIKNKKDNIWRKVFVTKNKVLPLTYDDSDSDTNSSNE